MVLGRNLRTGEVKVVVYHFECGMAEYFPERKDIAAIKQVVYGKGMSAKMGMQPFHA